MKKPLILLIRTYQRIISPALHQLLGVHSGCRYYPTCSEFAILQIQKYGILKGGQKAARRLLTCHPFAK